MVNNLPREIRLAVQRYNEEYSELLQQIVRLLRMIQRCNYDLQVFEEDRRAAKTGKTQKSCHCKENRFQNSHRKKNCLTSRFGDNELSTSSASSKCI